MPKTIKIKLVLDTDEALILSSCMSLKADNDIRAVMVAALETYVKLLRAKKNDGLVQVWYPNKDGKIEDVAL